VPPAPRRAVPSWPTADWPERESRPRDRKRLPGLAAMSACQGAAETARPERGAAPSMDRGRLDRSPHPYHRRGQEVPDRFHANGLNVAARDPRFHAVSAQAGVARPRSAHPARGGGRPRRRTPASSSDSGTEADDERGTFLKGLPAAPLRARKGLKGRSAADAEGSASPLLTPSASSVDSGGLSWAQVAGDRRRDMKGGRPDGERDGDRIRARYARRRRAELLRRAAETACLACVGYSACRGSGPDVSRGESLLAGFSPLVGPVPHGSIYSPVSPHRPHHIPLRPLSISPHETSPGLDLLDPYPLFLRPRPLSVSGGVGRMCCGMRAPR
jgi:hypothetical protein